MASEASGLKSDGDSELCHYTVFQFIFEQWDKIYSSYQALIVACTENREDVGDDYEETKYQVRGQDYAIDLYGVLDVMKLVITLMNKMQAPLGGTYQ